MNSADIIRMAREAGNDIERFATLVAAAERERIGDQWAEQLKTAIEDEREACARVCEDDVRTWSHPGSITRVECAAAIRARGAQS